jgi:7-cyano-7-deazaguanine synthase
MSERKAVVLLSGGLDSMTALAIAKSDGYVPHALTVWYGQRHAAEIAAAERVTRALDVREHRIIRLDLRSVTHSALTSSDVDVPKGRGADEMSLDIPVTYVPARNLILLSIALGWAETLDAECLVIGANSIDYSGYPDCRPEFIAAFEQMAGVATKAAVTGRRTIKVHAPLLRLAKAEIIRAGCALGLDYGITVSCYDPTPSGRACGHCDACILRRNGFRDAGVPDPTLYVE